jgi:hypothetical protein
MKRTAVYPTGVSTPNGRRSCGELQARLIDRVSGRGDAELESGTIVVLPSITFPAVELRKIVGIQYYEERLLCFLLFLGDNPDLRIVYVTSTPVDDAVVDYYLSWLDDPEDARSRLRMVSLGDPEPRGLTAKLLENPQSIEAIRSGVGDVERSLILPFNVTDLECRLSEELGVPLYGPRPDLVSLGSKSGSRRVARRAGLPVLEGSEDLRSTQEVAAALTSLRERRPDAAGAVIKLNNGFSGQGNAIVDLSGLRDRLEDSSVAFCAAGESWQSFSGKIEEEGAIVEEMVRHPRMTSPSVQVRIPPGGRPEVVSSHEQVLGDPDEQVYLGCLFPADPAYRAGIEEQAIRIAEVLASDGVIGSFGVDFLVVPEGEGIATYPAEINLRLGGTTHPFFAARLLTAARYDSARGALSGDGRELVYVATDNVKSDRYVGLEPAAVISAVARRGLAFDPDTRTGATLHLLGALREHGKLGMTCISDTTSTAQKLQAKVVEALDDLAREAGA